MVRQVSLIAVFLAVGLLARPAVALDQALLEKHPDWVAWSPEVFKRAQRENRFVLLHLAAVWCHWCHVMEQKTYTDPTVKNTLAERYIPVRVDHDARPDLASRYKAWGWPATIVFAPDGTEIVKRAGYIAPENFERLLHAIIDDPSPEQPARDKSFTAESGELSPKTRQRLEAMHREHYDAERGGLDLVTKFLDPDSVEYAMIRGARGDAAEMARARKTLDAALALEDPVWNGFYQYSVNKRWDRPHYEKIMRTQTRYLASYAQAYQLLGEARYLRAARNTRDYLNRFLRADNGAYYTSQDADLNPGEKAHDFFALSDKERLQRGMPAVDKNQYSRENAWVIESFIALFEAAGDPAVLADASTAARWLLAERRRPDGGYNHGAEDAGGPFLGDNLAVARAFLALYKATSERIWLSRAREVTDYIGEHFMADSGGAYTAVPDPQLPLPGERSVEENIRLARHANLLLHYTGEERYRIMAQQAMRFLASPDLIDQRLTEAGILIADDELGRDPSHLTVVAPRNNSTGTRLFRAALAHPSWYARTEWYDPAGQKLPHHDVTYPKLDRPAAFVCQNQRCSVPVYEAEKLLELANQLGPSM